MSDRKKWSTGILPKGYPKECGGDVLNDVIQDLSSELYDKIQDGKFNKLWEFLITNLIQSGHEELQHRNNKIAVRVSIAATIIAVASFLAQVLFSIHQDFHCGMISSSAGQPLSHYSECYRTFDLGIFGNKTFKVADFDAPYNQ